MVQTSTSDMATDKSNSFLLLYGSQTGNCKAISQDVAEEAAARGIGCRRVCMEDYKDDKDVKLEGETVVVVIVSTCGDGDAPDNASRLWRRMRKKTLASDHLAHIKYSILGLGDTNYSTYQAIPKGFHKRFSDLGAKNFYPCGYADDGTGLELVVEPWTEGLYDALKKALQDNSTEETKGIADTSSTASPSSSLLLLWGSETGNAKAIAEDLASEALSHGVECRLVCMEDYKADKLVKFQNETAIVIVVSSCGEGDAPDNASRLWTRLRKKSLPSDHLSHLKFSILGLGDTNYSTYQEIPKGFHKRLTDLGATSFYPSGYADDGTGLELVVEPWKEGLWSAVRKVLAEGDAKTSAQPTSGRDEATTTSSSSSTTTEEAVTETVSAELVQGLPPLSGLKLPKLQPSFLQVTIIADGDPTTPTTTPTTTTPTTPTTTEAEPAKPCPYQGGTLLSHTVLTTQEAVKRTIDVTVSYEGHYIAGDTFCMMCPNDFAEVEAISQRLAIDDIFNSQVSLTVDPKTKKKRAVVPEHLQFAQTLHECLGAFCDIRAALPKSVIRVLAEYTTNVHERHYLSYVCSRDGSERYMQLLQSEDLSISALLKTCPSCMPPYERVLELLPPLKPRRYSAASSPAHNPHEVRFILNVVDRGLCSSYLDYLGKAMENDVTNNKNKNKNDTATDDTTAVASSNEKCLSPRCQIISKPTAKATATQRRVVPLYREIKKIGTFNPPTDTTVPLIMIGPGTGLAPFLGFLQHRQYQRKATPDAKFGDTWLFFGNRNEQHDCLAKCEIQEYIKDGTLTHLHEAYSRDEGAKCKYVQDNFEHCGDAVVKAMLEDGGYMYVCGNSNGVVDDVGDHLTTLLVQHAKLERPKAIDTKVSWKESNRYVVEHFAG